MIRPKLLCVDDELSILQSLDRVFKNQFEVLSSEAPVQALDLLKQNPDCAIVLSDYRMPGMNGVEFLRHARTIAPLTSRAILSGQIDLAQISDAINNGDIHKFFLKPWENEYLALQMQEALQMHRTLREKAHYEQLAITDPITQLTNHRFFQDQIRLEIRKATDAKSPLSLIIVDVDHFKGFNDRFGHPEGDRLLFKVASFLQDFIKNRGFVSRYGGEEFTVILPGFETPEAEKLANEIRAKFERTSLAGPTSSPAFVTVSSGLASYPQHGANAADLIEAADKALYQAKRQGRNQVAIAASSKPR